MAKYWLNKAKESTYEKYARVTAEIYATHELDKYQRQMVWLLSIADSIATSILSLFIMIIMLWTFTMASLFGQENVQHLYCETSDSEIELCEKKEWSIVT